MNQTHKDYLKKIVQKDEELDIDGLALIIEQLSLAERDNNVSYKDIISKVSNDCHERIKLLQLQRLK